LGKRYDQSRVVWLAGGDINPAPEALDRWRALATGLKAGSSGRALVSFHPNSGSSCTWFHNDAWLDFDSNQSGHARIRPERGAIYTLIDNCYGMQPPKPIIDLESGYERVPNGLNQGRTRETVVPEADRLNAYDLRVRAYQTVFAGAFGYTYGAVDVPEFRTAADPPRWPPNKLWPDALQLPGASQVGFLRNLMESLPIEERAPAQQFLLTPTEWKYNRLQATGDTRGRWFLVYSSSGRPFSVDLSLVKGASASASWFDPRTGETHAIGRMPTEGKMDFTPPSSSPVPRDGVIKSAIAPGGDWVLKIVI
jgi:hypothetical protein